MITTEETLAVDGVILNTLAYNISTLAGRLRAPSLRTENVSVPGRHGTLRSRRKYYEEGQIVLPMWVRDTDSDGLNPSRETFFANIDMLTQLFRKTEGMLEVIHTLPDGSTRRVMAECTEAIDLSTKGRGLADFSVALRVPSVFWEDGTPVSHTVEQFPSASPLAVFSGTSAPIEDAVFVFNGPITNPRVEALYLGEPLAVPIWFQYSGTIGAGQSLTVDCGEWELSGAGGFTPEYVNFSHAGAPRWMEIQPGPVDGSPSLSFTGSNTDATSTVVVTARRKYLVG